MRLRCHVKGGFGPRNTAITQYSDTILRRVDSEETIPESVAHFKCRRIFGFHFASIVDPGGRNIRVAQPFLDLREIGIVVEGVGGGGGAQGVGTDLETKGQRVAAH